MVEQSLSVDNLFVFVLLFDYFKVPAAYQMRVLNWGIIGAVIFRGIFVGLGAATLAQYERARSRARARPLPRTVQPARTTVTPRLLPKKGQRSHRRRRPLAACGTQRRPPLI